MHVDRDRFLALTAALSLGLALTPGCATEAPPPAELPPPPAPRAPPPAPPPTVIYVMVPAAPPPPLQAEAPPREPPAPQPPPPLPLPIPSASVARPNPYDGTPVHAQACAPAKNYVGAPAACALRAPGPTCESFADTRTECPTLTKLLKPRVAGAAIDCLNRRSGTSEICEFNVTSICAYEALGSACLDPSAKRACDGVMARCGTRPRGNYNKMSRESCEAGVSGIADAKRAKFISCISESCRFETCLTYL